MNHRFLMRTSTLALICASGPALADVTPQEVWDDMVKTYETLGVEVEGRTSEAGGTLTVEDMVFRIAIPEKVTGEDETATFEMTTTGWQFVDNGDGTVAIVLPEALPIGVRGTDKGGEAFNVDMEMTGVNQEYLVSGDPDNMTTDYSADRLTVKILKVIAEGEEIPDMNMVYNMHDIVSQTVSTIGDMREVKYESTVDSADYTMDMAFPPVEKADGSGPVEGTGGVMKSSAEYGKMVMSASGSLPVDGFTQGFSDTIGAGTGGTMEMRLEDVSQTTEVTEGDMPMTYTTAYETAEASASLNEAGIQYGGTGAGLTVDLNAAQIPFPVNVAAEKFGFNALVPLLKSEDEQDYSLALELRDLTVNEEVWSMFDPQAKLPRDPATVSVDLSGALTLMQNLVESFESDTPPGLPNSLSLNALEVSLAGALLTGEGEVTFNHEDMQSYQGFPKPVGEASLELTGANTLLDTLVEMGLIPEAQATQGRMMVGMFAEQTGDDTLTSNIEFTEEGQILANGQRIK